MSNNLQVINNCDLTVETCIFQLVKIALKQKASAIAVRFDCKQRKIQVVDNSHGYTKGELASIFSKKNEESIKEEDIFVKIRCASSAVIVTSKHELSSHTYVKVANKKRDKFIQGYDRPSKGTTVTVYNYNSSSWTESNKNHSISYVLAVLAFIELKVSFSLRNNNDDKIVFSVGKPHSPWSVLKQMKANQLSEEIFQSVSPTMMNGKVDCVTENSEASKVNTSFITENGEASKENSSFITENNEASKANFNFPNVPLSILAHDCNDSNFNNNISSPLSVWSDWLYKPKLVANRNASVDSGIFFSSNEQVDVSNDACINLSQLSVWSDWSYHPAKSNFNVTIRNAHYQSPPISERFNKSTFKRDAFIMPKLAECRISSKTLNSLQIIKQINKEFIAAVANDNGKRLIILIDQHAIHERIRYEWLIEAYREKGRPRYISEKLHKDLFITNFDKNLLKLICTFKKVAMRVGIHVKGFVDSSTLVVDAVPKCFLKRKRIYNDDQNMFRLQKNVKQLLLEVAKGLSHNVLPPILPITINNVIASEACHGAIKFGDPLNIKECTLLVQALQDTKAPTRCAHGRPSIIPLLDLKDVEKQNCLKNKQLNFASLKRNISIQK